MSAPRQRWNQIAAVALCGGALALAALTVRELRSVSPINAPQPLAPFAATEREARLRELQGRFVTGAAPGDRVIVIETDRRVRFDMVDGRPAGLAMDDTFELGKRAQSVCLATARSGVIEALDLDHLMFHGDLYERQQTRPRQK